LARRYNSSEGSIDEGGSFSIAIPGTVADEVLQRDFEAVLAGYECSSVSVSSANTAFTALYFLGSDQSATATIVAASSRRFVDAEYVAGDQGVLWFYADRETTVEAECTSTLDGVDFSLDYSLALTIGWNSVIATITESSATAVSVEFEAAEIPAAIDWFLSEPTP
jgi:hypothetical protein